MDSAARQCDRHPGSVRVLGLDLDATTIAVSSLLLSIAGDTHIEAVRLFNGERAQRVVLTPGGAECGHPVMALGEMVAEVAEHANAIAFQAAPSRRDSRMHRNTAALACGPILGLGMARGIPVVPLGSAAIARALIAHQGASTAELAAALDARTIGLDPALASIHEPGRGVAINATAAALVGLEELAHWRVPAPSRPLRVAPHR